MTEGNTQIDFRSVYGNHCMVSFLHPLLIHGFGLHVGLHVGNGCSEFSLLLVLVLAVRYVSGVWRLLMPVQPGLNPKP